MYLFEIILLIFFLVIFFQVHGNMISGEEVLRDALEYLQETQVAAWNDLEHSMNQSLCLVSYLRSAVI